MYKCDCASVLNSVRSTLSGEPNQSSGMLTGLGSLDWLDCFQIPPLFVACYSARAVVRYV